MSDLLNSLLDSTVDELKDIPVFKPAPAGSYEAIFTYQQKVSDNTDLPYLEFKWRLINVIELTKEIPEDELPDFNKENGYNVIISAFPLVKDKKTGEVKRSDWGEGMIKKVVTSLKDDFPGANNGEILRGAEGAKVAVTFGIKKQKDKETEEVRFSNEFLTQVVMN